MLEVNKKSKFSHPQKQPKVRKMGTMVQHPFKFRKSHKLRNYGFFDVRGLFTEDRRLLFISVGAPNVKSPLKMSAVSAQFSAEARFRKSLLHGRLTKILYAAIFTRRYDFNSPPRRENSTISPSASWGQGFIILPSSAECGRSWL